MASQRYWGAAVIAVRDMPTYALLAWRLSRREA